MTVNENIIRFMSIGSGSSGNCYYLGIGNNGLLVDAGVPINTIRKHLKMAGIPLETHVNGILVTHDHADHIRTVGHLGGTRKFPVYATENVFGGIDKSRYNTDRVGVPERRFIRPGEPFSLAGFRITPFGVPHDATENIGFFFEAPDFSFTLATDVGHITDTLRGFASRSKHLVIEANYDREMLRTGPYPEFLKQRVSGPQGHLSNQETAEFLAEVFYPEMENIWLCHLSRDNNHPELCRKTIETRLFNEGVRVGKDVNLTALGRTTPSPLYALGYVSGETQADTSAFDREI